MMGPLPAKWDRYPRKKLPEDLIFENVTTARENID
jgi:hypothetical protein